MFEVSPEGIAVTDIRGNFIAVNQLAAIIFGYDTPADVIGKNILDVVHPADHINAYKIREIAVNEGVARDQKLNYIHPDNSIVSVTLTLSVLKDTSGNPFGFIGVSRGISEWRDEGSAEQKKYSEKSDQARIRSEELRQLYSNLRLEAANRRMVEANRDFLMEVLENTPDIVVFADDNFKIRYINKAGLDLIGVSSLNELLDVSVYDVLGEAEKADVLEKTIPQIMDTGIWKGESQIVSKSGKVIPLSIIISYHPSVDAQYRYASIIRDISDIRQQEETLRVSQEMYQTLAETAHDMITLSDPDHKIIYINKFGADLVGLPVDEIIGKNRSEILNLRQANQINKSDLNPQDISEPKYIEELFERPNGQIWVGSWIVPINSNNKNQSTLAISRDITHEKEIETRLSKSLSVEKELNDLKSRFVSMASHEFRTPLSSILSSVELLEAYSQIWDESKRKHHFHRIKESINIMNVLLEDILVIGKIDGGKFKSNPVEICPIDLCNQTVEEMVLNDKGQHKIHYNVIGSCKKIKLDPDILRQIITNLLSNAIKFSLPGGKIDVDLLCDDSAMKFVLSDEGIGIPENDLSRLYDPFMRGANVGAVPGSGLGMTIVKNAVELCNGQIEVISRENKGTKVIVNIPITQEMGE
jgi:PAS domain S-box-containing protein